VRRFSLLLLHLILLAAGGLLAVRFIAGPFRLPLVTVYSPINAAGATAVSFLLLALASTHNKSRASGLPCVNQWVILAGLLVIVAASFGRNLNAPFVYDDYTHIVQTSHATWRIVQDAFRQEPGGHGLFFRPIAFISYWVDYQWARAVATRWHAWSMAAHVVNAWLVYLLAMRSGLARTGAAGAALVFALHGSRAESVAWSDARSDLLATFFCLAALLALLGYCRGGRKRFLVPAVLATALGAYTKESAFCLPLLPLALLPVLNRAERGRAVRAGLALTIECAALFAYRWWALGGIGGYADRTGVSAVWHSRPLHTFEALFFRQWAFLFFPVNWSVPLEWWLRIAAAAFIAVLLFCAGRGAASRPHLLAGIAFLLAASLPVQHLLLFQPDFAGARVLYLPLAGLAIFWGAWLGGLSRRAQWAGGAALLAFNLAALEHNLRPWRTTPQAAVAACRAVGHALAQDPRPVILSGLPDRLDGVYFLGNGFPECVEMNSGQPMRRVYVTGRSPGVPPANARWFVWNAQTGTLQSRDGGPVN